MTNQVSGTGTTPAGLAACVGAIVFKADQALFVRQASGHPLAGQWTAPWGIIEPGETPEHAVVRETKEESGVRVRVEGLLGIQNLPAPFAGWIGIAFLCRHLEGAPTPDVTQETDAAAYLSLAEMDAFREPFEPWSAWLVRRVWRGEHRVIPAALDNPFKPQIAFL
jgi:8-oxo-dGTP diphosphatase